jgi:hypothetical protein
VVVTTTRHHHTTGDLLRNLVPIMEHPKDGDLDSGLVLWEALQRDTWLDGEVGGMTTICAKIKVSGVVGEIQAAAVGSTMEKVVHGHHRVHQAIRQPGMRVLGLALLLGDRTIVVFSRRIKLIPLVNYQPLIIPLLYIADNSYFAQVPSR